MIHYTYSFIYIRRLYILYTYNIMHMMVYMIYIIYVMMWAVVCGDTDGYDIRKDTGCSRVHACRECGYVDVLYRDECSMYGRMETYVCGKNDVHIACNDGSYVSVFSVCSSILWILLPVSLYYYLSYRRRIEHRMMDDILNSK